MSINSAIGRNSSAFDEILDGLTGRQRQRIRAVLDAEDCQPQTVAAVSDLAGRISGEITVAGPRDRPQRRGYPRLRTAWLRYRADHR